MRSVRTVLYNRTHDPDHGDARRHEARRDPGYDVATPRDVGASIYRTAGGCADWCGFIGPKAATASAIGRAIPTDSAISKSAMTTLIINVAHVIELSEDTPS